MVMGLNALAIANSRFEWGLYSTPVAIGYFVVRISMVLLAGYLATNRAGLGLWGSAVAGGVVFLAELLVPTTWFVLIGSWADVGRVWQSFLLLFWVPAGIGAVGGAIGRAHRRKKSAAI